jgi:hypothetical protein
MKSKKKILENYEQLSDAWAEEGFDFPSSILCDLRDDLPSEIKEEYEIMKEQAKKDLHLRAKSQGK